MSEIYDTLIIGSGPAGMAAAIYAARAEMSYAVIERTGVSGGQVLSTYEVDNYPGIPGISGSELSNRFREHCDHLQVNFIEAEVSRITKEDGLFHVVTDEAGELVSRTVVAATGASHRMLGCPGEEELAGMGVSYCATCDGAFFKGKPVAVVGGGDVAVEDAIFLARMCSKVYLIHRRDSFRAAGTLVSAAKALPNIEFVLSAVPEHIDGADMVESITVRTADGGERVLTVDGVFVAVGIAPETELFADLADRNEGGYLIAGEDCATTLPGLYAAGDARAKALRQIITAAADGANAITSVGAYLNN